MKGKKRKGKEEKKNIAKGTERKRNPPSRIMERKRKGKERRKKRKRKEKNN